MIKILRIEVDGHFHGSPDVPRPWVARIVGPDPKYGLARQFVDKLSDWRGARRACSGNLYGVVAAFPLRDGELYEVSRLRGSSSKRHVAREFMRVVAGKTCKLDLSEALAIADGHHGPAVEYIVDDGVSISLVRGLGSTDPISFALVDGRRLFRLRDGSLHEIQDAGGRRLLLVQDGTVSTVTQASALHWMAASIPSVAS